MGPYGSVWGDIKTGRSPVAPDHFWTPPDPMLAYKNPKNTKKSKQKPTILNLLALAAIHPWWGYWYEFLLSSIPVVHPLTHGVNPQVGDEKMQGQSLMVLSNVTA